MRTRRATLLGFAVAVVLLAGVGANRLPAKSPSRAPAAEPSATRFTPQHFAAALLAETNRVRAAHGCRALRGHRDLHAAADDQAAFMALTLTVRHDSLLPYQDTPADRVRRHGVRAQSVAENVAASSLDSALEGQSPEQIAARLVEQWMNSPGHRANLLNRQFTHFGGGIRLARRLGEQWCAFGTQVFTAQRASFRRSTS